MKINNTEIEQFRVKDGPFNSDESYGNNGAFVIPFEGKILTVIASDGEEWKPIQGFEDLYQVSNLGRVRSMGKIILKPEIMENNYQRIKLQNKGDNIKVLIHVLVAKAFIPNPNNYEMINHINGNPSCNIASNLEWCDQEYNINHAIESGLMRGLKIKEIIDIKEMIKNGVHSEEIEAKYDRSRQTISDIKHGRHRSLIQIKPSRYLGLPFWDHVSVSLPNRCPNWKEMCFIKDLFFYLDETVIQYHPPKSEHINNHPYCLHLWRPHEYVIPLPMSSMVGVKGLNLIKEK